MVKARYDVWFEGWHSLYEEYGSVNLVVSYARNITYSELLSEHTTLKSVHDDLKSRYYSLDSSNRMFQELTGLFVATTLIFVATTIHFARKKPKVKPEARPKAT